MLVFIWKIRKNYVTSVYSQSDLQTGNSPLPSIDQQATLQVSRQQQWQQSDKASSGDAPRPSGLWLRICWPTGRLSQERRWWKRGRERAIWPWLMMNRGQMNGYQGHCRKQLTLVINVHKYLSSSLQVCPASGQWIHDVMMREGKKISINHLPVMSVFPWCYFCLSSCWSGQRQEQSGCN